MFTDLFQMRIGCCSMRCYWCSSRHCISCVVVPALDNILKMKRPPYLNLQRQLVLFYLIQSQEIAVMEEELKVKTELINKHEKLIQGWRKELKDQLDKHLTELGESIADGEQALLEVKVLV
ncbi:hypothetical protein F8388_022958 [Cannabis sativa]|uniref:Mediator of RNA polymerase II transcription subunit 28 n=1 Tax=Cannabis sativa TaxID=3483 RepID=A0A7J6HTQ3_CANSA|nr:hypothetical protein F8388_022958 [Cannabis sativa]KAF4398684.1 hypothetical protein G4B88_017110 [Cannabis sativa]